MQFIKNLKAEMNKVDNKGSIVEMTFARKLSPSAVALYGERTALAMGLFERETERRVFCCAAGCKEEPLISSKHCREHDDVLKDKTSALKKLEESLKVETSEDNLTILRSKSSEEIKENALKIYKSFEVLIRLRIEVSSILFKSIDQGHKIRINFLTSLSKNFLELYNGTKDIDQMISFTEKEARNFGMQYRSSSYRQSPKERISNRLQRY